jgi:hypothetical protein
MKQEDFLQIAYSILPINIPDGGTFKSPLGRYVVNHGYVSDEIHYNEICKQIEEYIINPYAEHIFNAKLLLKHLKDTH